MTQEELVNLKRKFSYHPPKPGQAEMYEKLRAEALQLAVNFHSMCPTGRERSLALTKLEEAIMWANAAIARQEA